MITKREKAFVAMHPETGITVQVYRVDCFVEDFDTFGQSNFEFETRYYETEVEQAVLINPMVDGVRRTDVCVVCTVVSPGKFFMKVLEVPK